MSKFVFELEDVLKLRQFEQDQAQIELGKAVQAETEIQNGLNELANQHALTKRNIQGETDFQVISDANQFFKFLKIQEEHLLNELAKAKIFTEEKRKIFLACLQKTESLDKLKEKMHQEYLDEEKRKEQNKMSDIVNSKYNEKMRLEKIQQKEENQNQEE